MRRNQPEAALQRTCVDWLRIQERQGKLLFAHVPNGGKRSRIEAAIFMGLGVRAGFPDMIVILPNRAVFVELKAGKNKETDAQEWWADRLTAFGFEVHTVRSLEQLQSIVRGNTAVQAAGMTA